MAGRGGSFLRKLIVLAVLAAAVYAGLAWLQLRRAMDRGDGASRAARLQLGSAEGSAAGTSLPFVVRAAVVRTGAVENWLPDGGRLVERRLAWSPSGFGWVEDPLPDLPVVELAKLKLLAAEAPGALIEALSDEDPHRRQVADQALRLKAGQDFGYRPELHPESQAEAIAAWKRWWDANKVGWTLEKVRGIFGGKPSEKGR